MPTPVSISILTVFGLMYGFILHQAARAGVYRVIGVQLFDAYIFPWILGLASAYTPLFQYLAFGFKEFAPDAEGAKFTKWLHWAGCAETIFFIFYAVLILTTVRQRTDGGPTLDDIQGVVAWNIFFAIVAVLFAALAGLWHKLRNQDKHEG